MAQYIDKNRVEEILKNLWKEDNGQNPEHRICYNKAIQEVQCELDTLEVKEVHEEHISEDLEEAANQYAKKAGAQWADKHPDAISMNYLQSWYQYSIDETQEPIWTDKHLEELYEDFYLIPKEK